MLRNSGFAIAIFALAACLLTGAAAYGLSHGLRLWIRAREFEPAPGVIVRSEVVDVPSGRGRRVQKARIEFEHVVPGGAIRSDQLTIDPSEDLPASWAREYPVGRRVTVWRNRADPRDVVVERRFTEATFFLCLGWLMFVGMTVVFVVDAVDAVIWRSRRLPAGVVVHPQASGAVLHIPPYPAVAVGSFASFGFALIAIIGFTIASALDSDPFVTGSEAWLPTAAILIPGAIAHAWERYMARSGRRDLIIDTAQGMLTAPPGPSRPEVIVVPLATIQDVEVVVWEHVISTEYGTTTTYTYIPTIVYRPASAGWRNCHLVEWRDAGKAEALARWLRKHVGPNSAKVGAGGRGLGGERLPSILEGIEHG